MQAPVGGTHSGMPLAVLRIVRCVKWNVYTFKTLELTEEEALVMNLRAEGKSRQTVATMLGMTQNRVGMLLGRATRKKLAKERLKLQGTRKLRL